MLNKWANSITDRVNELSLSLNANIRVLEKLRPVLIYQQEETERLRKTVSVQTKLLRNLKKRIEQLENERES